MKTQVKGKPRFMHRVDAVNMSDGSVEPKFVTDAEYKANRTAVREGYADVAYLMVARDLEFPDNTRVAAALQWDDERTLQETIRRCTMRADLRAFQMVLEETPEEAEDFGIHDDDPMTLSEMEGDEEMIEKRNAELARMKEQMAEEARKHAEYMEWKAAQAKEATASPAPPPTQNPTA